MRDFFDLLGKNHNYRFTWMGQVVSEIGDHFNNIAVFSLALQHTKSGMVVTGIMLSRAVPAVLAGPLAGVLLDRMDRKRIMIISDLVRMVVALGFIAALKYDTIWMLYLLSALLMVASPFFTSGRAAILPSIASKEEIHTANSLTQTTQWATLTIGTLLGGGSVARFGYEWAFVLNSLSFLFSAFCISRLQVLGSSRAGPERTALTENQVVRPWHDYMEGLRYMRANPLILGIALVAVGWASGGGAAQVLFGLFGEIVFNRGPEGIGLIWGFAGIGLLIGGAIAHFIGRRLSYENYKTLIVFCYLVHGGAYMLFSQAQRFGVALFFITISRAAVAISSVLNFAQLLKHVSNEYRGRVFSTVETFSWSTMMLSMTAAGIASQHHGPREIGAWAGAFSSTTAIFWGWAHWTGRLPEPALSGVDPEEIEVHGEPNV